MSAETETVARFVAGARWEEVPAAVRHEARRSLLNFLGCAIGGCRDPALEHALAVLGRFAGPPQASLLGRAERLDLLSAAFLNGAAGNVFDFDDTHLPTVIHPTAPVAPAVLGLSETRSVTGAQLLHAFVLGLEVECRVGNAVSPWHYSRGWHITSTCGVIGAAAAAASLLNLDETQTTLALSHAANQAHGLVESLGTMAKSVSVGNAPRNGLLAAFLAERGVTASPQTLEGPRGFARVMGEGAELSRIVRGLGSEWEAAKNTYKPYPCGIVLHPAIEAFLKIRQEHSLTADMVERVLVAANPLLRERTWRPRPASGREAQVSLQHAAAVCFVRGAAGLAEYTDAQAADAAIVAFGGKVDLVDDAAMPVQAASVQVRTVDGRTLACEVREALGSVKRPMSDAQLEAKVRELARWGSPSVDAQALIDAVWRLDTAPDASHLMRLACSKAR